MAESLKEQPSSASGRSASRLLRYPLRSGSKQNEEKPPLSDSAPRRERSSSNVSKSVSVLDLSVKEKSAKPPRRLSNPPKPAASPASRPSGSITPISETRSKGSSVSDVSKSSSKKKFSVLSSSSYWVTQIKLSETAAKHSLSLGFFKLAFEAGCEPLQRVRDELKSYARKHNLGEFGESVKELFEKYNLTENFEQLQISETCSDMPDEDVHSSSSVAGDAAEKIKANQPKKEKSQKDDSVSKVRKAASNKNPSNLNSQKRIQKTKQEANNNKVKKSSKKSAHEDSINPLPVEKTLEEDKENLDTPRVDEIASSEV